MKKGVDFLVFARVCMYSQNTCSMQIYSGIMLELATDELAGEPKIDISD